MKRISALTGLVVIGLATACTGHTHVIYDPADGDLIVRNSNAGINTFEMVSHSDVILSENIAPGVLDGRFDIITPSKLFKLAPADTPPFNDINFGPIIPLGMSEEELLGEFSIVGALTRDNGEGGVRLFEDGGCMFGVPINTAQNICIPEPSGILLHGCALLFGLRLRRQCGA